MKEAEYIQFSWFSNGFVGQDIEQIYRDLVGTGAVASQKYNEVSSAQPFLCLANGNSGGLNYTVRFNNQRLDFIIRNEQKSNEIKSIDPIQDIRSELENTIKKISKFELSARPNAKRLALLINLCEISKTEREINEKFLELCPISLSVNEYSLLSFRFNKRNKIDQKNIINRIINYHINYFESVENAENNLFVLNVALDFNTIPEIPLDDGIQERIWKRLTHEALEFIKNPSVENLE